MIKVINAGKLEGEHGETVGVWLGLSEPLPGSKIEQVNIGFDILSQIAQYNFYLCQESINADDVVLYLNNKQEDR